MSKWAKLTRGLRARERGVEFTPLDSNKPQLVDLRVLDGGDYGEILKFATAFAKANGGEAKEGDEVYDFGVAKKTVQLGCVDPESPDDKPECYFASVDEVDEALDRDRINALANQHKLFQAATSPFPYALSNDEFLEQVVSIAFKEEGELHPFVTWPLDLQWNFVRSLAKRYAASPTHRSPTSSNDEPAETVQ